MASVISAGSAALRKAISSPWIRSWRTGSSDRSNAASPERSVSRDSLDSVVESEILPRLILAHSSEPRQRPVDGDTAIDPAEAERFAELSLDVDADQLLREVERYLERGVEIESIYLELLAPAARILGKYWEDDACDFVDVTMGLWRLQEVLREIALRSPPVAKAMAAPRSILLSPMPGEQHSFGPIMVEDVFARAGWQTELLIEPQRRQLLDRLAKDPFDLAGLTISCDCPSGSLSQLVTAIRSVSANPGIRILIGGRVVNERPAMVDESGADGTAADARTALDLAERMVFEARPETACAP